MLLLPAQAWVLNAADSYAHFLTLPVGLWTLAALIELAQRSLPTAVPAHAADRGRRRQGGSDAPAPIAPRCLPDRRCARVLIGDAVCLIAIKATQSTTFGIGSPAAIPSGNSLR